MTDKIENILIEYMPRVSKVNLAEHIKRIHEVDEIELPDLLLEALKNSLIINELDLQNIETRLHQ